MIRNPEVVSHRATNDAIHSGQSGVLTNSRVDRLVFEHSVDVEIT